MTGVVGVSLPMGGDAGRTADVGVDAGTVEGVVRVKWYALVSAITGSRQRAARVDLRTGHFPADSNSLFTIVTARPERSAPVTPPRTQFFPDTA